MKRTFFVLLCWVVCGGAVLGDTPHPVISAAYKAIWDDPVLNERIERGIRENRMADAVLRIPSLKAGSQVSIEQTRHSFLFGGNAFLFGDLKTPEKNQRYAETFGSLFNAATVAFYWKTLEKDRGKPRFEEGRSYEYRRPPTDPVVAYLESRGVSMNGHAIIYGMRRWGHPEWMPEDRKAMEVIFEQHVKTLAER